MQDLEQNIRFMLLEVTKQLEGTLKILEKPRSRTATTTSTT